MTAIVIDKNQRKPSEVAYKQLKDKSDVCFTLDRRIKCNGKQSKTSSASAIVKNSQSNSLDPHDVLLHWYAFETASEALKYKPWILNACSFVMSYIIRVSYSIEWVA